METLVTLGVGTKTTNPNSQQKKNLAFGPNLHPHSLENFNEYFMNSTFLKKYLKHLKILLILLKEMENQISEGEITSKKNSSYGNYSLKN